MRLPGHPRAARRLTGRLSVAGAGLAIALAALPAATGVLPGVRAAAARAADNTISQNNLRDGWDPNEPGLSPSVVSGGTFGLLPGFPVKVNGQVYAQPLVIDTASGPEVIVATENDWVYGINGTTGAILWSKSLGTPYTITNCDNVSPNIGVTSSPLYDAATGEIYLIAEIGTGTSTGFRFIAMNPASGAVTGSVPIGGRPTNDTSILFNAQKQLQRPGLVLNNGWVYAAFGSHCDYDPYVGFVAGVNVTTHAKTLWTDESGVTGDQGGIWQSGGGLVSDGRGRIFFTSGNGVSPAPGPGSKPPGQLAESIVRLHVNTNGSLSPKDFFSPANAPKLDAADTDWGSSGPMGLPFKTSNGTVTYSMIMQAGKDGRIFILDRTNLGGREQGPNNTDAHLAYGGRWGGQWSHPAAFGDAPTLTPANSSSSHDYMYYVGKNDYLRVFKFRANKYGKPYLSNIATTSATFGYASGAPVVTSNGNHPASAVVWEVAASGTGTGGVLEAFPATTVSAGWPSGCTTGCVLPTLFSAPTGTAASYSTPATSDNAVYVGTGDGYLYGFGVTTTAAALAGAPASFSNTSTGSTATRNVSVTAGSTVTVTGVSATTTMPSGTTQFAVDVGKVTETTPGSTSPAPVKFPVTLHKGDRLTAPVTFTPAGPGGVNGSLSFATQSAKQPTVSVPLSGDGIRAGLYANSQAVQFALVGDHGQFESWVPVGISVPRSIVFTNGGATPETLTTVHLPSAPFSVSGVPNLGTVLKPGQSFVATVTFSPGTAGLTYNDTLAVGAAEGSAAVGLASQSLSPNSLFQASPSSVDLGNVPVGQHASATITVTNTGNEPATMLGSTTLTAPFHAVYQVTPQLPVNAGYDLTLPVTFTPAQKGKFTVSYRITWTDVLGTHTLTIPVSGTGV